MVESSEGIEKPRGFYLPTYLYTLCVVFRTSLRTIVRKPSRHYSPTPDTRRRRRPRHNKNACLIPVIRLGRAKQEESDADSTDVLKLGGWTNGRGALIPLPALHSAPGPQGVLGLDEMIRRRGSALSSLEKQKSSSLLIGYDDDDGGTDTSPEPATPDDNGSFDGDNVLLQVKGKLSAFLCVQQQMGKRGAQLSTEAYHNQRLMSPMQERLNALTMIPSMLYCAWFLLSGSWWVSSALNSEVAASEESFFGVGCIQSPMFRERVPAMPPMTVVIGALGGFVHPIFSIIYHWWFATSLEPSKRVAHWSRRLDNVFIHFASACCSYATSGRLDYFLVNLLFNFDSALKQFEEKISPRRNTKRIGVSSKTPWPFLLQVVQPYLHLAKVSVLLYLFPMIVFGHLWEFAQFVTMFALSGWLFKLYPFGGWSHSL